MGASAFDQSTTAASNSDIGGVNQAEGCAPSTVNNATRALAAQMKGALIGVTASGTDTYAATLAPAPDALTDGMTVHIRFTNANATTTPTLNINSLGAKTIVKNGSAALVAGDIPAGHEGELRYNGTNFVLLNPKGASLGANTFTGTQTFVDTTAISSNGLSVGGGTNIKKVNATAVSLNFPSIASGAKADLTATVTGAVVGDIALVSFAQATRGSDLFYDAWVSAADTVTVRAFNRTGSAIDASADTFRVVVIGF